MAQQPISGLGLLIVEVYRSHKDTHTPDRSLWTSDQIVAVAATDTTHNKLKRRTYMFLAGFEPTTEAIKRPQTYVSDSKTTRIGTVVLRRVFLI